jgi:alpha-D-ribose 1-methylphosphonate 5-triphosphate synthase subunit PhnI
MTVLSKIFIFKSYVTILCHLYGLHPIEGRKVSLERGLACSFSKGALGYTDSVFTS